MQITLSSVAKRSISLQQNKIAGLLFANAILILGSHINIVNPLVPITMQTLAVCLTGVMFGSRMGMQAVLLWLLEAALGLPVLAGPNAGPAVFMGTTAGYLLSFPLMAYLCGKAADKKSDLLVLFVALLTHAICLTLGSLWLMSLLNISLSSALYVGFYPFIFGTFIKVALLFCLIKIGHNIRSAYFK